MGIMAMMEMVDWAPRTRSYAVREASPSTALPPDPRAEADDHCIKPVRTTSDLSPDEILADDLDLAAGRGLPLDR